MDDAGNAVITGSFYETLDLGNEPLVSAGADDIFVAALGPDGEALWSRRFGDAGSLQEGRVVAARPHGWLVAGHFAGTVDFGSGPRTSAGFTDLFVTAFRP